MFARALGRVAVGGVSLVLVACGGLVAGDDTGVTSQPGPGPSASPGEASTCGAGLRRCKSGTCQAESAASCGEACTPCGSPRSGNGEATCVAGACGYRCNAGFTACEDGCCAVINAHGARRLSVGAFGGCAIDAAGAVRCWGNFYSSAEVVVPAAEGAVSVTSGTDHACVLTSSGAVKCWGDNRYGQLGQGAAAFSKAPVSVLGLERGALGLAAGANHTCALSAAGRVLCWGVNSHLKALGRDGDSSAVPQDALTTDVFHQLASQASHTCALAPAGTVSCWGANEYGQLGLAPSLRGVATAVAIESLEGVVDIAVGYAHSCALAQDGVIRCWGAGPEGQLGDGRGTSSTSPVTVDAAAPATRVAAGGSHTCALTNVGGVQCWGSNIYGQIGTGQLGGLALRPRRVLGLERGVVEVAAGLSHTCALLQSGAVKCWGKGEQGQLGTDRGGASAAVPVNVVGFP